MNEVRDFVKFIQNPKQNKIFKWAVLAQNPIQTESSILVRMDNYYKDFFKVNPQ